MKLDKIHNIYRYSYMTLFVVIALFGRSATGIYFFGFRLGELMTAGCMLLSVYFLLVVSQKNKYFTIDRKSLLVHKIIIISFFATLFLTNGSLTSAYTYKSSSYIWTIAFLFLGLFAFRDIKTESLFFKILPFLLPATYILSTLFFPKFLVTFFTENSDKFDFLKSADVLLLFILTNIINQKQIKNNFNYLIYFLISSAVFLPLFLYKSKGSFLPAIIFVLFEVIRTRKIFSGEKLKSLLLIILCIPIFYGSAYISGVGLFGGSSATEDEDLITSVSTTVQKIAEEKNTTDLIGSFYIYNGRLYSEEMMTDWRLQIWQDAVRDLFWDFEYEDSNGYLYRTETIKNYDRFFTGFGYNEILPAMNHSSRRGTDMTNENLHNFAINIFVKGGILQIILFILFYLAIIRKWYLETGNFVLLSFLTYPLICAFFDVSMESVRFPFIFFGSVALLFNQHKVR